MAVDREFAYYIFGPDGPPGRPWGFQGPMGWPWGPMGTTWAPHGTQLDTRAKNVDFHMVFQWLAPETLIFLRFFGGSGRPKGDFSKDVPREIGGGGCQSRPDRVL